MMTHYLVTWAVDVDEADSPEQAAQLAASQYFQKRIAAGEKGTACVFVVADDQGEQTFVDLAGE